MPFSRKRGRTASMLSMVICQPKAAGAVITVTRFPRSARCSAVATDCQWPSASMNATWSPSCSGAVIASHTE